MAVGLLSTIEHCWARIIHPFINLDLVEFLFSPFKAQKPRFHFCSSSKVRNQSSRFMKCCYGFCRSCCHEYTELYSFDFHHVLNEILRFKVWLLNLVWFELFTWVRIRTNRYCIVVEHWKTNLIMCIAWILVVICSWPGFHWWAWWALPRIVFDLL